MTYQHFKIKTVIPTIPTPVNITFRIFSEGS